VGSDGSNRGLDIKGELSSPIYAAADGKVVYAGNALKGYGNLIIVKHNDNLISAYAHNETMLVGEQTYVRQGDKIATMGRADNGEVMLHFEIRRKGKSLDPLTFLPRR
jgi:lipoprotein NlpD